MRTVTRIALLGLAAALAALVVWTLTWPRPSSDAQVGRPAPPTAGTDADGAAFQLSDYRGKVVMLSFWGDW